MNSFSEGTKNIAANFLLFGGSMTVTVAGIAQASLQIRSLVTALDAASVAAGTTRAGFMSLTASVTTIAPWAALAVVIGTVGNALLDAWYIAQGLKTLKSAIDEVNKSPLDIAFNKTPGQIQKDIASIDQQIEDMRKRQIDNMNIGTMRVRFDTGKDVSGNGEEVYDKILKMQKEAQTNMEKYAPNNRVVSPEDLKLYEKYKTELKEVNKWLGEFEVSLNEAGKTEARFIDKLNQSKDKLKEASSEEYQFAAAIRSTVQGFSDYIPALDQTSESWKKYTNSQQNS
jgi:hypothetical protein